ncbi:MAG: glycosyltransferase [Armatimonadota bacterium]
MRCCVIGPLHPYRGGIAHHATSLCRRLSERHEVSAVSFSRLYPSILFPGKSQIDESKSAETFPAERIIDSVNPLTWRKAREHIRALRPDLLIVEWWHPFFGPSMGAVAGCAKTLFFCHNVLPHEPGMLARPLTRRALSRGEGFIVHSDEQKEILEELLPGRPVRKTVLPEADAFPRRGMGKAEARRILGIPGRTVLFFGLIREYKGLADLIRAMRDLPDVTCLVVGEFYDKKEKYDLSSVRVVDRYVPNEEVELYFAASDVVVLPYRSATQSGVVQTAWRFERPVIATAVGGLPEAVEHGRTGLVVPPEDPGALASAIRAYYAEGLEARFTEAVRAGAGRFSWERVIEVIEELA